MNLSFDFIYIALRLPKIKSNYSIGICKFVWNNASPQNCAASIITEMIQSNWKKYGRDSQTDLHQGDRETSGIWSRRTNQ